MTALVARTVERTFSGRRQYRSGLSRAEPNQAGGQDLGDFGESLGRRHEVGTEAIHGGFDRIAGSVSGSI